jgi:transposase
MAIRQIARQLRVSRNTVHAIISKQSKACESPRKNKKVVSPELLERLFHECENRARRLYEKLTEEEGISIGYSTLTRLLREQGLREEPKKRCGREPDEPGVEMQHDTSPYQRIIGGKKINIVASLVYYRYSKMRYLKFYRTFTRFQMKCFLHEAMMFMGHAAPTCIIDNTNLARLRGVGKHAVIVPEMKHFAEQYGFKFQCHELKHSNRKAGNERGFYTVETNFFPGRTFSDLEDLNQQALEWATVRCANRPTGKRKIIPTQAFEYEKPFLEKVAHFIHPPYKVHERRTDQYGYISFNGNYYWIPGTKREDMIVLEYSDAIHLFHDRIKMIEYSLPKDGVRNECFKPKDQAGPSCKPAYRKKPTAKEEKILREAAPEIDQYLSFALKGLGKARHRKIRRIYGLYRKCALPLLIRALKRALTYRIINLDTLERMVILELHTEGLDNHHPAIDPECYERAIFQEGLYTDETDLLVYDQMLEDEDGQ